MPLCLWPCPFARHSSPCLNHSQRRRLPHRSLCINRLAQMSAVSLSSIPALPGY